MHGEEWFNARELAEMELPGLPTTEKGLLQRAKREGWVSRKRAGHGGGREYHVSSLPEAARREPWRTADYLAVAGLALLSLALLAIRHRAPNLVAGYLRQWRLG